jgi:hypothetical protein
MMVAIALDAVFRGSATRWRVADQARRSVRDGDHAPSDGRVGVDTLLVVEDLATSDVERTGFPLLVRAFAAPK